MTDKRWKRTERNVAMLFGGARVPVTGRQRGDAPDVEHPALSIEVKDRKELPEWILDAMRQAVASRTGNKIPVVVLHQKGATVFESPVILRATDLKNLLQEIEDLKSEIADLSRELGFIKMFGS